MRRILYAFGGEGGVAITRAEAEVLFDINDASQGANNDPEWTDLFVKAIANCIMAASGYRRRRARWRWPVSGGSIRPMPGSAVSSPRWRPAASRASSRRTPCPGRGGVGRAQCGDATRKFALPRWSPVTRRSGWRGASHRDGHVGENEKALLRFIGNEAPQVHPSLKELIARAGLTGPARAGSRVPALPAGGHCRRPRLAVRGSRPPWPPSKRASVARPRPRRNGGHEPVVHVGRGAARHGARGRDRRRYGRRCCRAACRPASSSARWWSRSAASPTGFDPRRVFAAVGASRPRSPTRSLLVAPLGGDVAIAARFAHRARCSPASIRSA